MLLFIRYQEYAVLKNALMQEHGAWYYIFSQHLLEYGAADSRKHYSGLNEVHSPVNGARWTLMVRVVDSTRFYRPQQRVESAASGFEAVLMQMSGVVNAITKTPTAKEGGSSAGSLGR